MNYVVTAWLILCLCMPVGGYVSGKSGSGGALGEKR